VAEIEAHEVGMAVLPPLRELDEVAYLRFASVYRAFDDLEAFESEIALLRAEHALADEVTVSGGGDARRRTEST
jgi:transcriptional repressor NrdR